MILKVVRRDLIPSLPLPRRIIDYLSTPHYYSENLIDVEEVEEPSQHVSASLQADQVEEQQNEIPQAGGEIGGDNTADVQNVTVSNYVLIQNPSRVVNGSAERQS